ncbi:FAD-dependent monooxygenase [Mycolicibacterium hippocampi]|uniref:Oxygenase n=1 Tax=Mycolicibacterium hippocampi TaxID=659824 RepID=A0A7I9ZWT4_9MYCO|nr:FAD-dependent monooxygenase [Mycolicibacterium hippocampi]GFH05108.1 oxygenase [Mycolicibacterium hippocampi]
MTGRTADVLIAGAGPSGLTAAIELARRGVAVRIVDAASGPNTETRALGMQARTLELYQHAGLVERLLERGLRARIFNVFSENRQILRADFAGLDSPYPFLLMIPQNHTQNVLADHLAALGVAVERNVELTGLHQDPSGVAARLRHADGSVEEVTATWLVGADGAHSTVRHELGVGFVGSAFEENFAVADLRMDWVLPHDQFFAYLNRGRFVAYFPMLHGWHRIAVAQPADAVPDGDVTRDELQEAVDVCAPSGATIAEIRQAGRFRINQRRAQTHSKGRVFLVGDAAHIHSVVGAQGMNTGIADAMNLGWKLAAVAQGTAPPELLATYATERAPVAARLVEGTRRVTRMTLLRNPVSTAFRRRVAPLVLARPHVQQTLTRAISQIDVSYHDHSGAGPRGRVAVGDRAPALFEFDPTRHTLAWFGPEPPDTDRATEGFVDVVGTVVVADTAVWRRYGLPDGGLALIRPDGYLAYLDAHRDPALLRAQLNRTFIER